MSVAGDGSEGRVGMTGRRVLTCECGGRMYRKEGIGPMGDRVRYRECRACGRLAFFFVESVAVGGHLFWAGVEQAEGLRALSGYGASL